MSESFSPSQIRQEDMPQPFILSRCPEWRLTMGDDLQRSAERRGQEGVRNIEEMCVTSTLYTVQHTLDGGYRGYHRIVGFGDEVSQPAATQLKPRTFVEFRHSFLPVVDDTESRYAFIYSDLVHDIGKKHAVLEAVDYDKEKDNHDEALHRLFLPEYTAARQQFLATYESPDIFAPRTKELARGAIALPVNWAGIIQSQSPPTEYDKIPAGTDPKVIAMSFWHSAFDIAGVLGFKNPTAGLMLTEDTAQNILDARAAFLSTREELNPPAGIPLDGTLRNDLYLIMRGKRYGVDLVALRQAAEDVQRNIYIMGQNAEQMLEQRMQGRPAHELRPMTIPLFEYHEAKCQVIIANLGRCPGSPEAFARYRDGFNALQPTTRYMLMELLTGIMPYQFELDYGPAALKNLNDRAGVTQALEYLESVLSSADDVARQHAGTGTYLVALRQLAVEAAKPDFDISKVHQMTVALHGDHTIIVGPNTP